MSVLRSCQHRLLAGAAVTARARLRLGDHDRRVADRRRRLAAVVSPANASGNAHRRASLYSSSRTCAPRDSLRLQRGMRHCLGHFQHEAEFDRRQPFGVERRGRGRRAGCRARYRSRNSASLSQAARMPLSSAENPDPGFHGVAHFVAQRGDAFAGFLSQQCEQRCRRRLGLPRWIAAAAIIGRPTRKGGRLLRRRPCRTPRFPQANWNPAGWRRECRRWNIRPRRTVRR